MTGKPRKPQARVLYKGQVCHLLLQSFRKFLSGHQFRRFKINQFEKIIKSHKISTVLISAFFPTKIWPSDSRWKSSSVGIHKISKEWGLSNILREDWFYGWLSDVAAFFTKYHALKTPNLWEVVYIGVNNWSKWKERRKMARVCQLATWHIDHQCQLQPFFGHITSSIKMATSW